MNRPTKAQHGQGGMPPPPAQHHGLARYGSAPAGSFLAAIADVVRGGGDAHPSSQQQHKQHHQQQQQPVQSRFFSGESSGLTSCESSCRTDAAAVPRLQRAYGGSGEIHGPPPASLARQPGLAGGAGAGNNTAALLRHSSSPAGFLSRLVADPHAHGNGGMAGSRGAMGSYSHGAGGNGVDAMAQQRRLSSQWSFSRQDMMPHIAEMGMVMPGADIGESIATGGGNCSSDLSRSFSMGSWDDANSNIMFSSPSKKAKMQLDGDDGMFGLSSSSLEMGGMDDYMQMQQDSVACRVRAKRGCATHPRSIAERERRTRISKRLRRLQDLVPNMDKQTNTSDMLDIAVDYIKVLQDEIEKLKQDQANCSCSAKQEC